MKKPSHLFKAAAFAIALAMPANIATAAGDGPMVDGVIKEVRADGKLTIKHGPLPNLDMGAMTMVFTTSDPKMSSGVKVGDKVKIHVEDVGGKLTIMKLNKAN